MSSTKSLLWVYVLTLLSHPLPRRRASGLGDPIPPEPQRAHATANRKSNRFQSHASHSIRTGDHLWELLDLYFAKELRLTLYRTSQRNRPLFRRNLLDGKAWTLLDYKGSHDQPLGSVDSRDNRQRQKKGLKMLV